MNNRCPKCNEKLSPFYLKQNCPNCNTNLIYYDLEKRLEADHEKALKEQEALDRFLENLKLSTVGTKISLCRFILFFSPLVWMLLPMFKAADGVEISLLSVITGFIDGSITFNIIFDDLSYLFPITSLVGVIVFSLAVIISSCFSKSKKAYLRNIIFSIINLAVFSVCIVISKIFGASLGIGTVIILAVYIVEIVLHKQVDKKINNDTVS